MKHIIYVANYPSYASKVKTCRKGNDIIKIIFRPALVRNDIIRTK